jgi:2-keto-4-pentenoate hydratase/2-oxohepta-3-ene-1,7-dioic acid hydratase in catechol pathway
VIVRLATYESESGPRVAALRNGSCVDLNRYDPNLPDDVIGLLQGWTGFADRVRHAALHGPSLPPGSVKFLAPVPKPPKVICVGLNYKDHAAESGVPPPEEPVIFCKFSTAVRGPADPIVLPRASREVDYEAELAVVIGRGGRHIPRDQALAHVGGYTCANDVSARDWQLGKPGKQWLLGKTFDSFAPLGPHLVTADELGDPGQLAIRLRLNGAVMQDSNTRELIFPVPDLIAYVSQVITLEAGDVILTGTPPGVGFARKPPVFLKPGDLVEVEIEGIGVLRNSVVAEGAGT